jgi:hypothetical protein
VVTTRVETFGGVFDCKAQRWHDESANPVTWYLNEEQRRLALHDGLPDKVMCVGAEGAGKSRGVLAPWTLLQVIRFAGQNVEIGGTAPTQARLETLRLALVERMPPDWYVWRQRDWLFRFPLGVQLRLVGAHRASESEGSPIQGYDWVACATDEGQDQLAIMDDIEARGRRAPGGRYRRMMTCSVKDSPAYRSFEDRWNANPLCTVQRLPAFTNPFTAREHWENLKLTLDDRAYRRRVLAENLPSESRTYHTFDRKKNVRRVPELGARDVTMNVLRRFGQFGMLVGHDPGSIQDVSILMKAYQVAGTSAIAWWVVGEVVTKHTTSEQHFTKLLEVLQTKYFLQFAGAEDLKVLVMSDPQTDNEARGQPHLSVYRTARRLGFDIRSAAPEQQRVPKEARIEMVCRLLASAAGIRRLFIDLDERGAPCAETLVKSLEMSERDELGNAETAKKSDKSKDLSDATAALGYGLWRLEREKLEAA